MLVIFNIFVDFVHCERDPPLVLLLRAQWKQDGQEDENDNFNESCRLHHDAFETGGPSLVRTILGTSADTSNSQGQKNKNNLGQRYAREIEKRMRRWDTNPQHSAFCNGRRRNLLEPGFAPFCAEVPAKHLKKLFCR